MKALLHFWYLMKKTGNTYYRTNLACYTAFTLTLNFLRNSK